MAVLHRLNNQPKVSARELRRRFAGVAPAVDAALTNERVTHDRVEALEQAFAVWVAGLSWRDRLRWLVTGTLKKANTNAMAAPRGTD